MQINKDFFKVWNEIMDNPEHWDPKTGIGPNGMRLYLYLLRWMNRDTGYVCRKYQTIHEATGVPVRTLKTWMATLKKNGYVKITRFAQSIGIYVVPLNKRKGSRDPGKENQTSASNDTSLANDEPIEGRQSALHEVLKDDVSGAEPGPSGIFLPETEGPDGSESGAVQETVMGHSTGSEGPDDVTSAKDSTSLSARKTVVKAPTSATDSLPDKSLLKRFSLLESLGERGGDTQAELFWELASRVHQKIHHHPLLNKNLEKDLEKLKTFLLENKIKIKTLLVAYVFFCRSEKEWLNGKPRNIAMFLSQVEDYLTRASHKRERMEKWLRHRRELRAEIRNWFDNTFPIEILETEDPREWEERDWTLASEVSTAFYNDEEFKERFKSHALDEFQRYWVRGFTLYANYHPKERICA